MSGNKENNHSGPEGSEDAVGKKLENIERQWFLGDKELAEMPPRAQNWARSLLDSVQERLSVLSPENKKEAFESVEKQVLSLGAEISKKEQEIEDVRRKAKAIADRLDKFFRNKFLKYAVIGTLAGISIVKTAQETKRHEKDRISDVGKGTKAPDSDRLSDIGKENKEVEREDRLPELHMEQMDQELTRERMERILQETMPKGWYGEDVAKITYADEPGTSMKQYGMEGHAAANFVSGKSVITFFQGSKKFGAAFAIRSTLGHEIAHANDWARDKRMTKEERKELHEAILARVKADDRYRSSYVESIKTGDEDRSVEYWAEISEAYLAAEDPEKELPPADRMLVENAIRKTDPTFDQSAARLSREAIIAEIEAARIAREREQIVLSAQVVIDGLPMDKADKELARKRIASQKLMIESEDASEKQRSGREELVSLFKKWGTTEEKRVMAGLALRKYSELDPIVMGKVPADKIKEHLEIYPDLLKAIVHEEKLAPELGYAEFVAALDDIVQKNDLRLNGVQLERGELSQTSDSNWIRIATGWDDSVLFKQILDWKEK